MSLNGFQPDAALHTAFWRNQEKDFLGRVTNEVYVNFGDVKWFKTNRAVNPSVGGAQNQVLIWYNPKEQNPDPDQKLIGPPATALLTGLDSIWSGIGGTPGFQPDSSIDSGFWRWQYTNTSGQITNETYLNMTLVKYMKTSRVYSPVTGGQTDIVSLWFNVLTQDRNPDLVLDNGPSAALLALLDGIWLF
jgi:hypothetical protein